MTPDFSQSIAAQMLRYKTYSDLVEKLYLPAIIDSFQRLKLIPDIKTYIETQIRNYLVFDFENNNEILRPFLQTNILKLTKENTLLLSPEETKRTDIEFFISLYGDFVVECKNLRSAEQRYINEGIARFTEEFYSKKDSEAAMVGFIVGGNIKTIISGLKTKVGAFQLLSGSNYRFQEICIGYFNSFRSEHNRISKQSILIHHLFVDLS